MNIPTVSSNSFRGLYLPAQVVSDKTYNPCEKCVAQKDCSNQSNNLASCANSDVVLIKHYLFRNEHGSRLKKFYPHPMATKSGKHRKYSKKLIVTEIAGKLPFSRVEYNMYRNGMASLLSQKIQDDIENAIKKIAEEDFGGADFYTVLNSLEFKKSCTKKFPNY